MFATLSIEKLAENMIAELKFSASALAAIDGSIPSSTLSKALSGQTKLSAEKEESLRATLQAARALVAEYPYLPIDFNQIPRIKPLIEAKKKELRDTGDPIVPACMGIRLSYLGYFLRVNGTNVISTPSEMKCSVFEDVSLAEEAVRQIQKLGTNCKLERFGALRRKSTICNSLLEVGFQQESVAVEAQ
jgi:hypothetical protein